MPRTRAADMPSRQSPRDPPNLRTSSTDSSDPLPLHHPRLRTDKSPRLSEGRSPRGVQSHHPKKLGTRIADLESQLGLAQEELKSLKNQLSIPSDVSKRTAQEKKAPKKQIKKVNEVETQEVSENKDYDVFEVTVEKSSVESRSEIDFSPDEDDLVKPKAVTDELKFTLSDELALKNDEINDLKSNLDDTEKQLEILLQENAGLKSQLDEKSSKLTSAESETAEMKLKLNKLEEELEMSKSSFEQINEKLQATERAKLEVEEAMRKLRIQTEQWKKAAETAASALETDGRKIYERCGSMDNKHYYHGSSFEQFAGNYDYEGSLGMMIDNEGDHDEFGNGKRKGSSGIKMFGDLWKKKGVK